MKAIKMIQTFAVVYGVGEFPADMLRYDRCFPVRGLDASAMGDDCLYDTKGKRAIVVERCAEASGNFAADRWKSFGWTCEFFGDDDSAAKERADSLNAYYACVVRCKA